MSMKDEDWSRFMPNFKTDRSNRKSSEKKKTKKRKEPYTPFPPENHFTPSRVDKELETGEYFLKKEVSKKRKIESKNQKNTENAKNKKDERLKEKHTAPKEKKQKILDESKKSEPVNVKKLKSK